LKAFDDIFYGEDTEIVVKRFENIRFVNGGVKIPTYGGIKFPTHLYSYLSRPLQTFKIISTSV